MKVLFNVPEVNEDFLWDLTWKSNYLPNVGEAICIADFILPDTEAYTYFHNILAKEVYRTNFEESVYVLMERCDFHISRKKWMRDTKTGEVYLELEIKMNSTEFKVSNSNN